MSSNQLQSKTSSPLSVMHRGGVILKNELIVFGGQQGVFKSLSGDMNYTCTH